MSDLSKKAQETRKLVLKTLEKRASEKADEVFDWILSYFQKMLEFNVSLNCLTFDCYKEKYTFIPEYYICYRSDKITLMPVVPKISLDDFLDILKERIEREEGFKCELDVNIFSKEKEITVIIE